MDVFYSKSMNFISRLKVIPILLYVRHNKCKTFYDGHMKYTSIVQLLLNYNLKIIRSKQNKKYIELFKNVSHFITYIFYFILITYNL